MHPQPCYWAPAPPVARCWKPGNTTRSRSSLLPTSASSWRSKFSCRHVSRVCPEPVKSKVHVIRGFHHTWPHLAPRSRGFSSAATELREAARSAFRGCCRGGACGDRIPRIPVFILLGLMHVAHQGLQQQALTIHSGCTRHSLCSMRATRAQF